MDVGVKEFNKAFGSEEGCKHIREEYRAAQYRAAQYGAAQSTYINDILEEEDLRSYADPLTCRATSFHALRTISFAFFNSSRNMISTREKLLDREREQVRREMAEMRKAIWVNTKNDGKWKSSHKKFPFEVRI